MRRGQAALEYLMTYGWAILIIIIIGVALYAMGIFNPSTFIGKKYTGLSDFTILDFKAADNGTNDTFQVILSPRGHTFNITSVTTDNSMTCPYTGVINPTDKATITCYGKDMGNAGATYTLKLTINYVDQQTGLSHVSVGTFSGKIE